MDVGRAMLIPRQDDEVIVMVSAYLHRNLTVGLFVRISRRKSPRT